MGTVNTLSVPIQYTFYPPLSSPLPFSSPPLPPPLPPTGTVKIYRNLKDTKYSSQVHNLRKPGFLVLADFFPWFFKSKQLLGFLGKKTKGEAENQRNARLCIAESRNPGFLNNKTSVHTPSVLCAQRE
jgi:hypothetical protein